MKNDMTSYTELSIFAKPREASRPAKIAYGPPNKQKKNNNWNYIGQNTLFQIYLSIFSFYT